MTTLWKLSQYGLIASRTLDSGAIESRLITAIDADELATALPADTIPLSDLRNTRKDVIRAAYELDSNSNILVGTVTYQGGFDSAIKLDAAKRLAEAAGLTSVTFYDASDVAQTLTLPDAMVVVLTVAGAYQASLAKKQAAMVAIDAASTKTKINAVTY